jgi:hypothetical protein
MNHSNIVGGSTAKRVIACPASVALVAKMPPRPSNEHADRGTMLHDAIAKILDGAAAKSVIGMQYENQTLTQDLYDEKIVPALEAINAIDPEGRMEYAVESRVGFGDFLPSVFGSTDLLGRIGQRAIVLDWKFGDGVVVDAVENSQLLFYAAAAMRTPDVSWVFKGATEIECIIVQPPMVKRWVTTPLRVQQFEQDLAAAVRESSWEKATMKAGDHCRWCAAKPICPQMTGAVERVMRQQLSDLPKEQLAIQLQQADLIEDYIKDLRALVFQMLDNGQPVPGYKLVAKRATRSWVDDKAAHKFLLDAQVEPYKELEVISPAQAEKHLKKIGKELPSELVVSISSGSTLAADTDSRPAVLQIGKQLTAALSKLQ